MATHYKDELLYAKKTALAAGKILVEHFKQVVDIQLKPGDEPVTIADQKSNTLIANALKEAFPDDLVIAEESPLPIEDTQSERIWFVDPMDGTREFINQNQEFSVMIGLACKQKPVLGVIFQPLTGYLYWAIKDQGAYYQANPEEAAQRLRVSERSCFADLSCAISRSHHSEALVDFYRDLGISKFVTSGSIGLKLALISRQICDVYVNFSGTTSVWDACAPQILLEEAGGRITDLHGRPLRYSPLAIKNSQGILATNGPMHEKILAEIGPQWDNYQARSR